MFVTPRPLVVHYKMSFFFPVSMQHRWLDDWFGLSNSVTVVVKHILISFSLLLLKPNEPRLLYLESVGLYNTWKIKLFFKLNFGFLQLWKQDSWNSCHKLFHDNFLVCSIKPTTPIPFTTVPIPKSPKSLPPACVRLSSVCTEWLTVESQLQEIMVPGNPLLKEYIQ